MQRACSGLRLQPLPAGGVGSHRAAGWRSSFWTAVLAAPRLHRELLFVTPLLVESRSAEEHWDLPRWADRRSPPAALLHATAKVWRSSFWMAVLVV